MTGTPKRMSVKDLCAGAGVPEDEIEKVVDELNAAVPPETLAEHGPDYKLVTIHTDEFGERYVLLHATVEMR